MRSRRFRRRMLQQQVPCWPQQHHFKWGGANLWICCCCCSDSKSWWFCSSLQKRVGNEDPNARHDDAHHLLLDFFKLQEHWKTLLLLQNFYKRPNDSKWLGIVAQTDGQRWVFQQRVWVWTFFFPWSPWSTWLGLCANGWKLEEVGIWSCGFVSGVLGPSCWKQTTHIQEDQRS